MDKASYDGVLFNGRSGTLRFGAEGLGWRESGGGKTYAVTPNEVKRITARLAARGYRLTVELKNGTSMVFDALPKRIDEIKRNLSHLLKVDVDVVELNAKGLNWGEAEVRGNALVFLSNGREVFQVPLSQVGNTAQGKNEVILEMAHDAKAPGVELLDMRLFVPNTQPAGETEAADGAAGDEEERRQLTASEVLLDSIREHLEGGKVMGEKLVSFESVSCVYPRGRFTVELYSKFINLHGATFAHKIKYDSIASLMLLPNDKDRLKFLLVGLSVPLRQGQTQYNFIVFQIDNNLDGSCEVNLPDEELERRGIKRLYGGDDELSAVLADLLSGMSGRPLTSNGNFADSGEIGQASAFLRCSYKTNEGVLFPLDKQLVFLFKPPMVLRYQDIVNVEFSRIARSVGGGRSFDMRVMMASGVVHNFAQLLREEYDRLVRFFREKKIAMQTDEMGGSGDEDDAHDDDDDEDEDDEDFDEEDEEDEERPRRRSGDDEELDSEEEDEDFAPSDESDDGDASESSESDEDGGDAASPPAKRPAKGKEEAAPKKRKTEAKEPAKKAKEPAKKAKETKKAKPPAKEPKKGQMADTLDESDLED